MGTQRGFNNTSLWFWLQELGLSRSLVGSPLTSSVYSLRNYSSVAAKSRQSCPTLCDPIDGSLSAPPPPVPGILQARTLEWVAFSNAWKWKVKVKLLSRIQLSDPMDWSLPGSSIHGIFQARVLEWVAIAFSMSIQIHRTLTWQVKQSHYLKQLELKECSCLQGQILWRLTMCG